MASHIASHILQMATTGQRRLGNLSTQTFADQSIAGVFFLKRKADVPELFRKFAQRIQTETGNKIKTLRSDNEGEFTGGQMNKGGQRQWNDYNIY